MIPREVRPPHAAVTWMVLAASVWVVAAVMWEGPRPLEAQEFHGDVVVLTDVRAGRYGPWALVRGEPGVLLARLPADSSAEPGDVMVIIGSIRGEPGRASNLHYRATVRVDTADLVGSSGSLSHQVGSGVRSHVMRQLSPVDDGRALLAGFLIGEVSGLSEHDQEAMRRSGLAHFVAVSGSNVALVLLLVFVAAGPLALGPKRRAIVGLLALPVYAAATRFEPSVMRASVMAALALGGRLLGVVLHPWQLLPLAVGLLIVLDPALTDSLGFQMSVAATAGVMVGARWPITGGKAQRALAVTIGAQLAVSPLLMANFGSVPLLSPVANLVAAPLVAVSTLFGAVGVVVPGPFVEVASYLAELVLRIARGASTWPQLGMMQFIGLVAAALLVWRRPKTRPAIAALACAGLVVWLISPSSRPPDPGLVVFDVGQGDSILIHSDGRFALVDGGPDELVLADKLRAYGVDHLDLVVLTHVHADHASGLMGLFGRFGVAGLWADISPHATAASSALMAAAADHGVPIQVPLPGDTYWLGSMRLTVEGPIRRYASPNDQSVVLVVEGPARSAILSGDIETFAQADLAHLQADVLKVPHQGGGTSTPDWLRGVGASLAVISVGPNQFGHPAEWVIAVLEDSGAMVVRTDEDGDVLVPLG